MRRRVCLRQALQWAMSGTAGAWISKPTSASAAVVAAAASTASSAASASTAAAPADDDRIAAGRLLRFPYDHGAHNNAHLEWWYITGLLTDHGAPGPVTTPDRPPRGLRGRLGSGPASAADDASPKDPTSVQPTHGFQITFFRYRTGLAEALSGRLAPRQLLFAHAALTDLAARRHLHAQRIARWNGSATDGAAHAQRGDTALALARWTLVRDAGTGRYRTQFALTPAEGGVTLALDLVPTQALLLQGDRGHSRKGPQTEHASHYYSQPHLHAAGRLTQQGRVRQVTGRAWLDHEWSDALLAPDAVGWDWIGMNLDDGSALTAFQLRRADGSALWTGGSFRDAAGTVRSFGPNDLRWQPGRVWVSLETGARYPVQWTLDTPLGRYRVASLLDAQELDSRSGTGSVYWEGLSALLDANGRRIGYGYLEMTGYAGRLRT